MGWRSLAALLLIIGCGSTDDTGPMRPVEDRRPTRIVSLDLCADQYALAFADPDQILGVSPDAASDASYMAGKAAGIPVIRPRAESILLARPDLIVRAYGGGPGAAAFFEQAGIPVLQLGWASRLDGEGAGTIPHQIKTVAAGLGHPEKGRDAATRYRNRLAAIRADVPPTEDGLEVLYLTPGGVTTGPGSLVDQMIKAAGLLNAETEPGWRELPLERLTRNRLAGTPPDLIATAFYDTKAKNAHPWSAARHPAMAALMDQVPTLALPGAVTACAGWFTADAVEALAAARQRLSQ